MACCIGTSSCSKDDEVNASENTRAMLINKKWMVTSSTSIDSLNNQTDLLANTEAFKKDDYFLFKPDSTYELNDNLVLRYDTASVIIDAGRWELSPDQEEIIRISNVFTTEYPPATIKEITDTSLFLESRFEGDNSIIRSRYRRIE